MKTRTMFLATVRWMKSFIFLLADRLGLTQEMQISFMLVGKAGETGTIGADVFGWFKPEKLVVFDGEGKASDAMLQMAFVDGVSQFPATASSGIPCAAFAAHVVGNGLSWDIARRHIDLMVQFPKDAKFFATIFGKAI